MSHLSEWQSACEDSEAMGQGCHTSTGNSDEKQGRDSWVEDTLTVETSSQAQCSQAPGTCEALSWQEDATVENQASIASFITGNGGACVTPAGWGRKTMSSTSPGQVSNILSQKKP